MDADSVVVAADAARRLAVDLLIARRVLPEDAATVARCLVRADLRGAASHGLSRLPVYLDRIEKGFVDPAPRLDPRRVASAAAHLDGRNGLGVVVASRAMSEAVSLAREAGIGVVGVSRSGHFGTVTTYLLQAAEADMAAIVLTNAAPAMPPWGGRAAMFGTNPLGIGVPMANGPPFLLDMATSAMARGRIRRAAEAGLPIPEHMATDAEGRPTTDAAAAMAGLLLPVGGPKGAGLAMAIDLLAGLLTGAAFGGDVGDQYRAPERPQDVGHLFLALRPDLFMDRDALTGRLRRFAEGLARAPTAPGAAVRMPGARGAASEARRLSQGIPYPRAQILDLLRLGRDAGLVVPDLSDLAPRDT